MPETLRRRNRLSAQQSRIVLLITAASGILGALAGCHPTQTPYMDPLLAGLVAAVTAWSGATSVWWAVGAGAAVMAVAQPSSWHLIVALIVCIVMFGVGALRESAAVTRSLGAFAVAQLALRLDLRHPFGLSALLAGVVMTVIVVSGLQRRSSYARRVARFAAFGVLGFCVLSFVLLILVGLSARNDITRGVDDATTGLRAMRSGSTDKASQSLHDAASSLSKARSTVRSPLLWPAKLIPVLSQHVHTAERLVSAARDTATVVANAVAGIDVKGVKVRSGVVDLSTLDTLTLPLEVTRDAVVQLDSVVLSSRSGWLLDPLAARLRQLVRETAKATVQARNAVDASTLAPSLLGADGKRVWLVLFTTPAEARGLGGFPGNWAEITTDHGRITVTAKGSIVGLIDGGNNKNGRILHAPADYLARYGPYGGGKNGAPMNPEFWDNVDMSPDLPTVAAVAADLYAQSGGGRVDGVIVADPYALQGIVTLTGPLTIGQTGTVITPSNVVPYLLIDQYKEFSGATLNRKDALQDVSDQAIKALLSKDLPSPVTIARAFGKALSTGHLQMWSLRAQDQAPIKALGIGGVMPAATSDGVSYTINNAGPNKLDTFLTRSMSYDALVDERSGAVSATLTITLRNTLPVPITLPAEVISNSFGFPKGTNRPWLTIYTPLQIIQSQVNGVDRAFGSAPELGWRTHDTKVTVLPGQTTVITLRLAGKVGVADGYSWVTRPQPLSSANNLSVRIRFKHGTRSIRYSGTLEVVARLTP